MSTNYLHYDPRIAAKSEEAESVGVVWTTQSVNWALDAMKMGQSIKRSPFFEGNPDLRKGNLVFQYSDEEYQEILKSAKNIVHFIEKHCKVKRPDGKIGTIKLRPYQYRQIKDYLENEEIILGWSRQSGKTVGTALYILWCMMFNADKATAILANKGATSREVLDKIKAIYKHLPFYMKAGIMGWNGGVMSFDNGCRIFTGPTTKDALNGKTCNILYIDEMAYVGKGANKIEYQKDFLANAIPVLSSQKHSGLCKLIMSSTPVGKEYFYELFDNALKGKNSFKASKVCWWEIPDKDIAWAKNEISKIGISKFKQQYEMSFDVHAETLLSVKTMRRLLSTRKDFAEDQYDILSEYNDYLFIDNTIEIDDEFDVFCLSVDIAEGLAQDYSTIQILRVELDDNMKVKYRQIGLFACNTIPIEDFALVCRELFNALNPEYSKLLVESNTYGDFFFKCLNDETSDIEIPLESICKFKRSSSAESVTKGLRTNAQIKKIAVKSFKTITDNQSLVVQEESTVREIENFQKNSKGLYCASVGHDDKVTPLINFAYWVQLGEPDFQYWLEEFAELNGVELSEASKRMKDKMQEDEIDINSLPESVKEFL